MDLGSWFIWQVRSLGAIARLVHETDWAYGLFAVVASLAVGIAVYLLLKRSSILIQWLVEAATRIVSRAALGILIGNLAIYAAFYTGNTLLEERLHIEQAWADNVTPILTNRTEFRLAVSKLMALFPPIDLNLRPEPDGGKAKGPVRFPYGNMTAWDFSDKHDEKAEKVREKLQFMIEELVTLPVRLLELLLQVMDTFLFRAKL